MATEQTDATEPRSGRSLISTMFCRGPLIGNDYEVLDLQVTVATVFDIFLGLHFLVRFLGDSRGDDSLFAHLMWRTTNRRSGWHR